MPSALTKIGMTYKDTAKISQDAPSITEYYEEGMTTSTFREKNCKAPKLTFSLMNADVQTLANYVGGFVGVSGNKKTWNYSGSAAAANKAIMVETEQGLDFEIPNGDIEAVINADMSAKGIFLVDFVVTPMTVTNGSPFRGVSKYEIIVDPNSLFNTGYLRPDDYLFEDAFLLTG
jgi:hypothetical protein